MNDRICFYAQPFHGISSYCDMVDAAVQYQLAGVEGFSQFEFSVPDVKAAMKVKKYADEKHIKFPCFSVYINLVGEDFEQMLARIKGYAEVAAALGSPYLHHTIAANCSEPAEVLPYKEELYARGVECVREVYDYAKTLGVKTIYEDQGYIFNGVKGFGRFLDEVNRDVGVVADFGNIYQSHDTIEDFIRAFADRVVHAHIKDVALTVEQGPYGLKTLSDRYFNETPIGMGEVDIPGAINLLKQAGYQGYYGIENGGYEKNSPEVDRMLKLIDGWLK
ncbi:MAG: sugar phosphate isomerase/epimerase [Ruminococcaceae bacterium]|nr:sugar phosphate isomerase/epimerase [Oscillospiraceae bacterium]